MWKERLKRILIIAVVGGLTAWGATAFVKWREAKKVAGESIKLPTEVVTEKIEELGEQVLGKAVDILPESEKIKEKEKVVEKEATKTEVQTTETTKVLETQTKEIIEILKQLPEEQLKQIKKQIFKDFCEEIMGE
ncbi:MAG: hypothetical protein ACPLXP_00995 [Microgenomates group bacterium]